MRNAFAAEVTRLADADERVVLLAGDIGNRLFDDFKSRHPDRFFNCGVAEANMTSVAAGLASCGLRPITYTITPFVTTRCLEQIRVDVCYHALPVTIVSVGAGMGYAELGPTHHACEDIAFLRVLPGMSVVCPADPVETRLAIRAAIQYPGPVYVRLGKKGEPVLHREEPDFVIGKAITMRSGRDVCLLATGVILPVALALADELSKQGLSAEVVSFHTVKPLDEDYLRRAFAAFPIVATIEEHSLLGGFGSAVGEWLSDRPQLASRLLRFGTADHFMHQSGDQDYARKHYGLTAELLAEKIVRTLQSEVPQ